MKWTVEELKKSRFPAKLGEIPEPPKKLFLVGQMPEPETKFLAVVGSRKYSEYGKEACEKLVSGLSGYPVAIVSGLAIGIDSIAHRLALRAGLKTVAVPGSGLGEKTIYPPTSRRLAEEIVEAGGALLSEFLPDQKAAPWTFPRRNRIMAGLSDAVLVVEAEMKSGTLITARLALDYNRDVLAVPGSMFSPNAEGPHFLIKNGATPIRTAEEILLALGFEAKGTQKSMEEVLRICSQEEKEIVSALSSPKTRDELSEEINRPLCDINITLSMLEIKGVIKESLGEISLR